MHIRLSLFLAVGWLVTSSALHAADSAAPAPLVAGWTVLKEGKAEGTAEIDAKHLTNPNAHLLKIAITKYPEFGQGRLGLKNSTPIAIKAGQSYDITFNGISEGIGVGLVFSLETDDGKVLARTTLPEIGRGSGRGGTGGRGGPGATSAPGSSNALGTNTAVVSPGRTVEASPPWRNYMLSVKAVASSTNAHLIVTAIEPVPVWIETLTITERQSSP